MHIYKSLSFLRNNYCKLKHTLLRLQDAYQFVKDKRPAISPNLNFMGQLVQFEKELLSSPNNSLKLDIEVYLPTSRQIELSEAIRQSAGSRGSSANNTPEPKSAGGNIVSASVEKCGQPFLLKMPKPRKMQNETVPITCAPLPNQHTSVSSGVNNTSFSLLTSPSSSSNSTTAVKDIIKKFEKSD